MADIAQKLITAIFILMVGNITAQTITVDPNSLDVGRDFVSVGFTLTITAEQYEAMQYQETTFQQFFNRLNILRYFDTMVANVKRLIADKWTIADLKKLDR